MRCPFTSSIWMFVVIAENPVRSTCITDPLPGGLVTANVPIDCMVSLRSSTDEGSCTPADPSLSASQSVALFTSAVVAKKKSMMPFTVCQPTSGPITGVSGQTVVLVTPSVSSMLDESGYVAYGAFA